MLLIYVNMEHGYFNMLFIYVNMQHNHFTYYLFVWSCIIVIACLHAIYLCCILKKTPNMLHVNIIMLQVDNLSYMIGQKYATLKFIYSPVVKHFDRISLHNVAV